MEKRINKKKFNQLLYLRMNELSLNTKFSKKDIEFFTDSFLETCIEAFQQKQKIFFSGFGVWSVREKKSTVKTNPKNPHIRVNVPSKNTLKFKSSNRLIDLLN
jgi:nucleoid DNA-binding protein